MTTIQPQTLSCKCVTQKLTRYPLKALKDNFSECKTKKKKTDRLRKAILQTPITNQECKRNNCIYFSLHHTVGKHKFPLPINYPKPSTTCGQNCVCVESLESLLCNVYTLDKKQLSHHDPCKHQNNLLQSGCTLFLLGNYQFVPWPSLDRHLFSADQRNLGYPDLVAQLGKSGKLATHWNSVSVSSSLTCGQRILTTRRRTSIGNTQQRWYNTSNGTHKSQTKLHDNSTKHNIRRDMLHLLYI